MNSFVTHSRETLIFRDGRPFGDKGHVDGGSLQWPMPSTVVGMFRNRVGLSRSAHFFDGPERKNNIEAIKKVSAKLILPLWQAGNSEEWTPLFPAPADALVIDGVENNRYRIHNFEFLHLGTDAGIDLPWNNWLVPTTTVREKPAHENPPLWFQDVFFHWLEHGHIDDEINSAELGVQFPTCEFRMHTAIDDSGTAANSQLFSTRGIRLEAAEEKNETGEYLVHPGGRYGVGVELTGLQTGDNPTGPCKLGGDRKIAHVESISQLLSECPNWFKEERYLRLILISPGKFGSWAPDWLRPKTDVQNTPWCTPPGSDIELRLVSAFVPRWQSVSGWDLEVGAPRSTAKLTPAGSVYIVELRNPLQSPELASLLWGKSIADENETTDAQGCVCVGKLDYQGE